MSPEKQRIAIAEICGWKGPTHPENIAGMVGWWSQNREVWWLSPEGKRVMISSVPDYLNSLDAMHEAEVTLTDDQYERFQVGLANLVSRSPFDTYGHWSDVGSVRTVSASAAQRAEAFLKTFNRWEDGE